MGLLLGVVVHPPHVQERNGAMALLRQARRRFPFVERVIGDAGYQGPRMAVAVARTCCWIIGSCAAAIDIALSNCLTDVLSNTHWA